jgi:hypothetical protein
MPGIVTHNKIFQESARLILNGPKKNYLSRSVAALLADRNFRRAALFGAIGPNIFDYIPFRMKGPLFGSHLSFLIHNGGADRLIDNMAGQIYSSSDKNTEWSAARRAYLYGFISHIIADSVFHPYVFYKSGFPDTVSPKELRYYREQNLLFQYNIDNYYEYYDEKTADLKFRLKDMLPSGRGLGGSVTFASVKSMLLDAIKKSYPDIYSKIIWKEGNELRQPLTDLDLIPFFIRRAYTLKRSANPRIESLLDRLRRNPWTGSDFSVRYPKPRKLNRDALNLHKDRWQNPSGRGGLRYDSIDNLFAAACEKIVTVWEKIESSLYAAPDFSASEFMEINAYTGEPDYKFEDMRLKEPVKIYL